MHSRDVVTVVLADVDGLGDGIRLSHLTELLQLFEIEPTTTRAMVSRMRRGGLLSTTRDGRESVYAVTDVLRRRLEEERARSVLPPAAEWSGEWTMVIYQIPERDRARRERLKRELAEDGFGHLTPTTWISPHGDREALHRRLGCHDDPSITVVTATTGELALDREMVRRSWNLDEIAGYYRDFIAQWRPHLERPAPTGREAFRERVLLVSDWYHLPRHDPVLPLPLQPDGWPAADALALFHELVGRVRPAAQEFVRAGLRG